MTLYFQGSETTQRESLLDTLTVRHPAETPLIRTLPAKSIANVVHEYSIDRPFLSADNVRAVGTPHENSRSEGQDFVEDGSHYPVRLKNIAEILHFSKKISNTDIKANVAGMSNVLDYRAGQLFTKLLNGQETILMYGQGSPETSGTGADERRAQGLIFWGAWTGLQRVHGTALDNINDPYNVTIPSDFWSVWYDGQGTSLSAMMLYNNILATAARAGAYIPGMIGHVGYKLKNLIARFALDPAGVAVNERTIGAGEAGFVDTIDWIKTPMGTIGFRTNRYLDAEGSTYTVNNSDFTPGTPVSGGSINKTFQADETLVMYEPGTVTVTYYRPPHWQYVPAQGDYTWVAAVSEFSLEVLHPLCVIGGGNLIG